MNPTIARFVDTRRAIVDISRTNFTDVSAVVLSAEDIGDGVATKLEATGFGLPVFVVAGPDDDIDLDVHGVTGVLASDDHNAEFFGRMVETAAKKYDRTVLPPFFGALMNYDDEANRVGLPRSPGRAVLPAATRRGGRSSSIFGENVFRDDLCNADVALGDLLIHEGPALEAQTHAAAVFGADKTYFVLNGTSTSNKVVTSALLTRGDIVLFDRNNHKSIHHGALFKAGAIPVYLEADRNGFGLVGADRLGPLRTRTTSASRSARSRVRDKSAKRSVRSAWPSSSCAPTTAPSTTRARSWRDRSLCDYILFDEAWVGFGAFHPADGGLSPLLLELGRGRPRVIVDPIHAQAAAPDSRRPPRSTCAMRTSRARSVTSSTSGSTNAS